MHRTRRHSALSLVALPPVLALATIAAQAVLETNAHADEDLGAPFGSLKLVDEIDTGNPADSHALYEDPPGASKVATVLGKSARVLPMTDDAQVIAYKIGAGKGLVAGKAYVLVVEYPEDEGRQFVVINRGGEMTRTYATGQTIGDSRESYTYPSPESIKYPLSGKWQSVRSLFYLGERFQGVKASRDAGKAVWEGTPAGGFWVVIGHFRKKDSPLDAGAAVARIRLFEAPPDAALEQPIHFPPADLPRRHVFWREEMADTSMGSSDPTHRFFSKSLDVFDAKMRLAKFLGVDTYSRHLLVFGYTQYWDNAHGGGNDWYYNTAQPELWGQMVDQAQKHGLDVMPYYEYAGAMGNGASGTPSLGKQRRCRPLGERPGGAFSDVSWSEIACVDVTDPEFATDVDKLLDATIGQYKGKANFVGAWFRTRNSNWPISFADATLARYAKDAGVTAPTRAQLEADATLLAKYYAWWFGKRRDFLLHIRDHLRLTQPDAAVLFSSYVEEALHVPDITDLATPNDDPPTWDKVNGTLPWQWRFAPTPWQPFVDAGKYGEMITRMKAPTADTLAKGGAERDHSAPPADPSRYVDVEGVHMAMPFSRLFTVSSQKQLDAFRAKSGLAIVRHFNLNEEDGQDAGSPAGPMSKKVGYFVTDVDHVGPYSMLAEARSVAFGDPRYVGYLASSNFSRGFPEYTRAFNAAYLALPALPSTMVASAASDPEVIVREIKTDTHGTYYAVVHTGLVAKTGVTVKLPATGTIHDLVSNLDIGSSSSALSLPLYPGELRALLVGGDGAATDAGPLPDGGIRPPVDGGGGDGGIGDPDGGNVDGGGSSDGGSGDSGGSSSGCGCRAGVTDDGEKTAWVAFGGLLVGGIAMRRSRRRARS